MLRLRTLLAILAIAAAASAEISAGFATRDITPNPLLPVSGGVGPSRPTTQAKGTLSVRAMVFAKGDTKVAIVGVDSLGFPSVLGDQARAKITEIAPENVLIGATHSHSAPDMYGFPNSEGGTNADLDYLQTVVTAIADAVNDAATHVQPARLKIGSGEIKGKVAYNYYAPQLYDPRCGVIQALTPDGKVIATLVNYAVHPEVIGSGQGILSPDLCGPLYDRIQEKTGAPGMFMNGAQGGMVTADTRDLATLKPNGTSEKESNTWEECIRIGTTLADEALAIVQSAPVQEDPQLVCTSRRTSFPIDSPLMQMLIQNSPLLKKGIKNGDATKAETQMNLINLGNAQILTIPGEALPNIGYYLKRNMNGEHNLVFGLTNDAFGYILVEEDFDSFERYEYVSETSLGEQTWPTLKEAALKLVADTPEPDALAPTSAQ